MLISTPPANSHQLTNSLTSSNALHSSLPSSFSTSSLPPLSTTNPSTWTIEQVKEWLIKCDLEDCIDLICSQHRMNGQRLMNLKEEDVLNLKGTTKSNELWLQIKQLQQFYSSNYHIWTQRQSSLHQRQFQQSLPMTASSYFTPPPLQAPIPLRPLSPLIQVRPTTSRVSAPSSSAVAAAAVPIMPTTQSSASASSSSSSLSSIASHTTVQMNPNQQEDHHHQQLHQNFSTITSTNTNQTQTATPTTILIERAPLTMTRSTNNQQNHRRSSSHSMSTSNTSVNILPPSSTSTAQRITNPLLNPHRTPADQIEDQPITGCCFVGSIRSDRKKTLSACLLALSTVYFCSFIITIVDERLPDPKNFPPLPDLILDNVKQIPWAFSVTEKIILIEVLTLIMILVLHRHRLIIIRRLFAIAAALYFLRSLTMVFTSLPVATQTTDCRPERLASFAARLKKATLIFLGQGMSSFGVKTCGDYLYSGHTCTLVLATHFINECM
ncbi:hypothetical protein I4U23_009766 [Adineta vaga]|nr:hypothetical protein I4U23_009766 [Adineta vaga]